MDLCKEGNFVKLFPLSILFTLKGEKWLMESELLPFITDHIFRGGIGIQKRGCEDTKNILLFKKVGKSLK